MTAPETELVHLAVRGDRDAAAELFARIRPDVVRYCRAHLGGVGGAYTTADDIAQEVCMAILRSLPRFREQGRPFAAFAYGIAAHKVIDAQRAAARQLAVAPADSLFERADATPGPEDQAVRIDLARRLSRLLSHLSHSQREIVVLRVAVGLAADEVGAAMGMSATAVRMAQSRALAQLRTLARAQP